MLATLAAFTCLLILLGAAGFHLYWGLGGRVGFDAALPQHPGGQRVFTPSNNAALAVGALLLLAAALVAALGTPVALRGPGSGPGLDGGHPAPLLLRLAVGSLALVFLARALGPFRYAGWFKTVRDTRFARYDTWLYCPLCLVLGLGLSGLVWAAA